MSPYYIHPFALVDTPSVGDATRIWAFTHVMSGAVIGENCNIGEHCFIESGAVVGDGVTLKNGNQLWDGVTLGDGTFIGPQVVFTNDRWPRSPRMNFARVRYLSDAWKLPTVVERGATIGAGAVLLCGIVIHEFALIGAGSVVTRDVPEHALVLGNPARLVGWVCCCGARISFRRSRARCSSCYLQFYLSERGVELRKFGSGKIRVVRPKRNTAA
jgi:acetyltransferase-like isoleucine patch superfamily enzyme